MKKQQPIFIVSSGRTGSTLISRILNNHKKICIISDLIEPVGDNRFFEDNKKVSSFEFFNLISRRTSLSRIYYWRKKKTKELERYDPISISIKNETNIDQLISKIKI